MLTYRAPLREFSFLMREVFAVPRLLSALGRTDTDIEDIETVLRELAELCEETVLPINQPTSEEGCRLEGDRVVTPRGLREAYVSFTKGGWTAISGEPEHGGHGMPQFVGALAAEIVSACSISFGDYIGLTTMAYQLLRQHAPADLQERYVAELLAGRLGATMCMTESHCGTDLGLIRTSADPLDDGCYRITGTKMFISGGDHDLTDNIVHLVLARARGAPAGVRGLSLFLVPKVLPATGAEPAQRNSVFARSVEHKMGYGASATCQMAFEGARGWLIGERDRGLPAMFAMINPARLAVATQGIAAAEIAYQNATQYACTRLQGRSLAGALHPDLPADPIIVHGDVRRLLMQSRAFVEAGRAALLWLWINIDGSKHHPDALTREEMTDWVELLTPVVKAALADLGFKACNDCLQVFGGHGYIRDTGMEQLVRDVRIATIQEGTTAVMSLDLVRRQLPKHGGRAYRRMLDRMRSTARDAAARLDEECIRCFEEAIDQLERSTTWLQDRAALDANEVGVAGCDYLHMFGLTVLAWFWMMILVSLPRHAVGDDVAVFYASKRHLGEFFLKRMLPSSKSHVTAMKAGARSVMAMPAEWF